MGLGNLNEVNIIEGGQSFRDASITVSRDDHRDVNVGNESTWDRKDHKSWLRLPVSMSWPLPPGKSPPKRALEVLKIHSADQCIIFDK